MHLAIPVRCILTDAACYVLHGISDRNEIPAQGTAVIAKCIELVLTRALVLFRGLGNQWMLLQSER